MHRDFPLCVGPVGVGELPWRLRGTFVSSQYCLGDTNTVVPGYTVERVDFIVELADFIGTNFCKHRCLRNFRCFNYLQMTIHPQKRENLHPTKITSYAQHVRT